jgi:hypothetical protein
VTLLERSGPMKSDADGWEIFSGNLDDWNATLKAPYTIDHRSTLVDGAQRDFHRVAVSEAGEVVAEECERLAGTCCFVSTKTLRATKIRKQ